MSFQDFKWSPTEKKISRAAFDKAFDNEMAELKKILQEKISQISSNEDVWALHDYLTERRRWIDEKYDYRYSQLIRVFGILLSEGYLPEDDIKGLAEDKVELIKRFAKEFK